MGASRLCLAVLRAANVVPLLFAGSFLLPDPARALDTDLVRWCVVHYVPRATPPSSGNETTVAVTKQTFCYSVAQMGGEDGGTRDEPVVPPGASPSPNDESACERLKAQLEQKELAFDIAVNRVDELAPTLEAAIKGTNDARTDEARAQSSWTVRHQTCQRAAAVVADDFDELKTMVCGLKRGQDRIDCIDGLELSAENEKDLDDMVEACNAENDVRTIWDQARQRREQAEAVETQLREMLDREVDRVKSLQADMVRLRARLRQCR